MMLFTVLLALIVAWVVVSPEAPTTFGGSAALAELTTPGWHTAPALAAYLFGAVGIAAANTALGLRAIRRCGTLTPHARRRHNIISLAESLWLVLGLGGVGLLGYGRWVAVNLRLGNVPLAGELAAFAPFVVALLATWATDYPFYRLARWKLLDSCPDSSSGRRPWSLRQYISYSSRHSLLFILVPVSLIFAAWDAFYLYAGPYLPRSSLGEYTMFAAIATSAVAVFFIAPLLVVRIWKTEPLASRPLRSGLEQTCRQLKLSYRDILIWKSDGMIANAGVMGLAGRVRYVLLSDGLLENLDHRLVKAVFAHEAGHIASRHILYSAAFIVAAVLLCGAAGAFATEAAQLDRAHEAGLTAGLLVLALGLGFGWISRRFERQSDVTAAWAAGAQGHSGAAQQDPKARADEQRVTPEGAAVYARALEGIARINGIPMNQRGWRHGSIASRVSYILWLGSTGGSRRGIDRVVGRIKLAILLMLACGVALTVLWEATHP
ncbi:MAG: M48 family metallopeptidase [Planctomycetota bacterium]|jgi:STE24 endopeptidase